MKKNPFLTNPYKLPQIEEFNPSNSAPLKEGATKVNNIRSFSPKISKKPKQSNLASLLASDQDLVGNKSIKPKEINLQIRGDFYIFTLKSPCIHCMANYLKLLEEYPYIQFHIFYFELYEASQKQIQNFLNDNQLIIRKREYFVANDKKQQLSNEYINFVEGRRHLKGISFHKINLEEEMKNYLTNLNRNILGNPPQSS